MTDDTITPRNAMAEARERMVREQIIARGVRDHRVIRAMMTVPRELFVPEEHRDEAYEDRPLPIGKGQFIPQPYIVAYMLESLLLRGNEKVLEAGAGSGYAAALLALLAREVFAIEKDPDLAAQARRNLAAAGFDMVRVIEGDACKGLPEEAPFDGVMISFGVAEVPQTLKDQLAIHGRLVAAVGPHPVARELVRLTRREDGTFDREALADIRLVPPMDEEGGVDLEASESARPRVIETRPRIHEDLPALISRSATAFERVEEADIDALVERAGDARIVLLGEASHGTSEFYRMRARITRRLIEEKGFNIVALEADWPDAARIDHYVRHMDAPPAEWTAFARFPTWMWRNEEFRALVDWLHEYNRPLPFEKRAGIHGLDLYAMHTAMQRVIEYLEKVDPELARIAKERYACLEPWQADPAAYGHAALTGRYRECEADVVAMLVDLFRKQTELMKGDGEWFLDAAQNARLVANAERYYRVMYYGSAASWNLRDTHMFETLRLVMAFRGPDAKAIIWAHNSHIGDAAETEMSARGEINIGHLVREHFPGESWHVGFGTDHGTVAAASEWNGPMEIKRVRPSHRQSFEHQFHRTGLPGLIVPLSRGADPHLRAALAEPKLERAIGVIYRPETELASHYFEARLSRQFDDYIWIDETSAVTPIPAESLRAVPDTYPFGL